MAALAQLKALVTADARGFKAGMRDAKGSVSSFQSALRSMGGYIASAFSVGAVVAWGKSVIQWASSLSIAARNAGVLTSSFMAFNRVATQAGMSTDQLSQLFQRIEDQLDNAANGTGNAADAFGRLGLKVEDLVRMSPEERMVAIARASTQVGGSVSALADLFGMRLGPQARAALQDIADGLPEIDKKAGDTADQIERMASAWGKLIDEAKEASAGPLTGIAEFLRKSVSGLKEMFKSDPSESRSAFWRGFYKLPVDDADAQAERDRIAKEQAQKDKLARLDAIRATAEAASRAAEDENQKIADARLEGLDKTVRDAEIAEGEILKAMEGAAAKQISLLESIKQAKAELASLPSDDPEAQGLREMKQAEVDSLALILESNKAREALLEQRLQMVREYLAEDVAAHEKAEDEKRRSEIQSDLDRARSEAGRAWDSLFSEMDGARGEGVRTDAMARMGGMIGGSRASLGVTDRQIKLQEISNRNTANIAARMDEVKALLQQLGEVSSTMGDY